jgi:hypothetical protein
MPHTLVMTSNPIAINAIPATMRKSLPARLCMNETKEPMVCVLLYFFLRPCQHNGGTRSQAYLYTSGMERAFAGNSAWNAAILQKMKY